MLSIMLLQGAVSKAYLAIKHNPADNHSFTFCLQILDRCMAAAQSYGQQQLSQLDSQIAEVEDMLSYCNDVFMNGRTAAAPCAGDWLASYHLRMQ
jgi:hypothetical protein